MPLSANELVATVQLQPSVEDAAEMGSSPVFSEVATYFATVNGRECKFEFSKEIDADPYHAWSLSVRDVETREQIGRQVSGESQLAVIEYFPFHAI